MKTFLQAEQVILFFGTRKAAINTKIAAGSETITSGIVITKTVKPILIANNNPLIPSQRFLLLLVLKLLQFGHWI